MNKLCVGFGSGRRDNHGGSRQIRIPNIGTGFKGTVLSSFFNCQRRNKDHCALINCGGVEFLKPKKNLIQLRNEFSPQTFEMGCLIGK